LALETESYDENHFTVAISLPVSLTLRQHSINLHLDSKLEGFDEDEVIPIKQVSCIHSYQNYSFFIWTAEIAKLFCFIAFVFDKL
jgi:hypothetical protein